MRVVRVGEAPDITLNLTETLDESGERAAITYTLVAENTTELQATPVVVSFRFPDQVVHIEGSEMSPVACRVNQSTAAPAGALVVCGETETLTLGEDESATFVFKGLVSNGSDLSVAKATVNGGRNDRHRFAESDYDNNEAQSSVPILDFVSADTSTTISEARPILEYFQEVTSDLVGKTDDNACNTFMDEIFDKMVALRASNPSWFDNISFGKISSAPEPQVGVTNEGVGHYGVVVYTKGSNYHRSGIVIHGVINFPNQYMTDGSVFEYDYVASTALSGRFLQTRIHAWQSGRSREALSRRGFYFDSDYPDGSGGVAGGLPGCPVTPGGTVIKSHSPIDLRLRRNDGHRVHTRWDEISVYELEQDAAAYTFWDDNHETIGWELVLPQDLYDLDVVGVGVGPYTVTVTTFDEDGAPIERVFEGTTKVGQVDELGVVGQAPPPGTDVPTADTDADTDEDTDTDAPEAGGCACNGTGGAPALGWWILGLAMARRRAARRTFLHRS